MALGPAGFGPRVRARVDQAGELKDAPAQTLHPWTEENLAVVTTIFKSRALYNHVQVRSFNVIHI